MPSPLRNTQNQHPVSVKQQVGAKRRASLPPTTENARFWCDQYRQLQHVRVTEAEEQLQTFVEESEKRESSLKIYAHHLELENKQLKEAKREADAKVTQLSNERSEMQTTIQMQAHELRLYQTLTATTVSNVDQSKEVACDWTVAKEGSNQSLAFRLTSLSKEGENSPLMIQYELLSKPKIDLPDFLQGAIEFEAAETPGLLQHVLKSMFDD